MKSDPDYPSICEVLDLFLSDEIDAGDLEGFVDEMHEDGTQNAEGYTTAEWLLICAVGYEVYKMFQRQISVQQLRISVKRLIAATRTPDAAVEGG